MATQAIRPLGLVILLFCGCATEPDTPGTAVAPARSAVVDADVLPPAVRNRPARGPIAACRTVADCPANLEVCAAWACVAHVCVRQVRPQTTPCSDGSICTAEDHCNAGECVGSPLLFDEVVAASADETPHAVAVLPGADAYAYAGERANPGGGTAALIVQVSRFGAVTWAQTLNPGADARALALAAGPAGLLAVGEVASPMGTATDAYAVALHQDGTVNWETKLGAANDDRFRAALPLGADWLVAGQRGPQAWAVRLDAAGEVQWQALLGSESTPTVAWAATALAEQGALLAGTRATAPGPAQPWLARLDGAGKVLWQSMVAVPHAAGWTGVASLLDGGLWLTGWQGEGPARQGRIVRLDAQLQPAVDAVVSGTTLCLAPAACANVGLDSLTLDKNGWAYLVASFDQGDTAGSAWLKVRWDGAVDQVARPDGTAMALGGVGYGLVGVSRVATPQGLRTRLTRTLADGGTTCQGGAPCTIPCDDGLACTLDTCGAAGGCSHDAAKLEGAPCATGKTCHAGACL